METLKCLICGYHETLDEFEELDECPECGSEDIYYSEDITDSIIDEDSFEFEEMDDEIDFDYEEEEED